MRRLPPVSAALYRRITLVALVALCFIIVTGGAVRLTGSGLGCSDWPGCEQSRFVAPLELHPMVEFVNRLVTGLVSVTIAVAVLGSLRRVPRRRDLTLLSLGLVAGVIGQIVLGAFTVAFELAPPFVMGHFLLSLALVTDAVVLHHRAGLPDGSPRTVDVVEPDTRRLVVALGPALTLAVFAGTVVTGSGPHGGDEEAPRFGFAIDTVARLHSFAVILFVCGLLVAITRLDKEKAPAAVQARARQLFTVAAAQAVVGWVQYFTDVPALLVGVHILGATLVWVALCRLVLSCRAPEPVADRVGYGVLVADGGAA